MTVPRTLLLAALTLAQPAIARTWTSTDGRTLEAEFVSATEAAVTVRKEKNGTLVKIRREQLAPADWKFVESKLTEAERGHDYLALITGAWEKENFKSRLPYRIFGGRKIRADENYPLVVYLHGIHVRGSDNEKHLTGEALRTAKGKIKYTEFKEDGHLVSGKVFKDAMVHQWLFEQKRS